MGTLSLTIKRAPPLYEVCIKSKVQSNSALSIDVAYAHVSAGALHIEQIREGLFTEHNRKCEASGQGRVVNVKDHIVSINGVSGSADGLVAQLKQFEERKSVSLI